METTSSVVAGIPSVTEWSGVFTQDVTLGRLVCVVSVMGEQTSEVGKQKIDAFRQFSQTDVTKEQFIAFFQEFSVQGLQLSAGLITEEESLFVTAGMGRVELLRDHGTHTILASMPDWQPQFMRGQVLSGDYVVLGTETFYSTVFGDLVSSIDPIEKVSELASQTTVIEHAGCAGVVVGVAIPTKPVIPVSKLNVVPPVENQKPFSSKRPTLRFPKRSKLRIGPRTYRVLLLLCILGVIVGGILGVQRMVLARRSSRLNSVLAPYQKRLDDVTAETDRVQKIQNLRSLITDLEALEEKQKSDVSLARAIDALEDKARSVYSEISSEKSIQKLQIFYDFRLVAADFIGSAVGFDKPGKLAVFLDSAHNRVLSLSVENKSAQTLSVDEKLSGPIALAVDNRKAFVLGKAGVLELSLPLDQMGHMVVAPDGEWKSPEALGVFGTNLYVLDPERRALVRFDSTDTTASGSAWLRDKEGIEFSELAGLAIDGEVWMTTEKGKVLRFARGEQVNFTLKDAIGLPTSTLAIYTHPDSQNLYLLEPRAKRLLIYTKTGEYVSSVVSDDLSTASNLIVDEDSKTAYVLAGSLVYAVKLE